MSQKQAIKKQKNKLEALKREAEDERTRARNAARERVLQDFEKGQLGVGNSGVGYVIGTGAKDTAKTQEGADEESKFLSITIILQFCRSSLCHD